MESGDLFESLIGQEFGFYGVDCNRFKIGRYVFEAVEDPDDGYRSYLRSVEVTNPEGLVFFPRAIAKVRLGETDGYDRLYFLTDVNDGHVWLTFGTRDAQDYYPCFAFEYTPRRSDSIEPESDDDTDYDGIVGVIRDMVNLGEDNGYILDWLHSSAAALRYEVHSPEMEETLLNVIRRLMKGENQ